MGFLEDRELSDVPSIPEYYNGKTVFITGGTGFIGKLLIEKLLYSCSELDRIYLLLRSKKGVNPEERLSKMYSAECFSRLWKERPGVFESKVHAVSGDVMDEGLGLSEDDRTLLVNRVNIIFHVAASVRFDDPLYYAVKMNLKGIVQMVDLAKDTRNLSAFVHVSTTFCNKNRNQIEEVMYPAHANWRDTLKICDEVDPHTLRVLTPKYLVGAPNTYTFTKQLAEHVVYEQRGILPIVIVRPSIVVSTVAEPFPGWIDNFNGIVGMFVGAGKGVLRIMQVDSKLSLDIIPADITVKNMVAAAWIRGTKTLKTIDDIPVYHSASIECLKTTMEVMSTTSMTIAEQIPLDNIVWKVHLSMSKSRIRYYITFLLVQLLPALVIDSFLWIIGMKPRLLKIQRRIFSANMALLPFALKQWNFTNTNFVSLSSRIKKQDRDDFDFDLKDLNYKEYMTDSILGGRRYLLKERDEDLPKAKSHRNRMNSLDMAVKIFFYVFLIQWLYNLIFIAILN